MKSRKDFEVLLIFKIFKTLSSIWFNESLSFLDLIGIKLDLKMFAFGTEKQLSLKKQLFIVHITT